MSLNHTIDHIVTFGEGDVDRLREYAEVILDAIEYGVRVVVAVDAEGFKVKVDNRSWSPGLGAVTCTHDQ